MAISPRPLAVITGASSGLGLELARCCVYGGYDAIVAAAGPEIYDVALGLRASGANVEAMQVDLATQAGAECLYEALSGQQVHALLAHVDTNVTGTLHLLHKVGADMRAAGVGRILIAGSIACALRAELNGVSVTCVMPGATGTDLFENEQAPEEVAKAGFEAMQRGDGDVTASHGNKLRRSAA
jgi:uncharacterized protein